MGAEASGEWLGSVAVVVTVVVVCMWAGSTFCL